MNQPEYEAREARLLEIRHQAESKGTVTEPGIRAVGSPLPMASPQTGYYQQPLLKEPQWTPLVPFYFFVGGASGTLGVIGALADLLGGDEELASKARWIALGGAGLSSLLLIVDLGRPTRFLNMLRVFKPQSAMSVGSWVLSAFSTSAGLCGAADLLARLFGPHFVFSLLRGFGRIGCVLFGMPFHNYTGVLLAASAIPVWNHRIRSLPREFGMSGLQAGVSLLELTGETGNPALNALGLVSAGFESWEGIDLLRTRHASLRPAKKGGSGFLVQLAGILSGPVPIALRLASLFVKDKKRMRRAAAVSGIVGSLLLRYGWMRAGTESARDWRTPLEMDPPERDNPSQNGDPHNHRVEQQLPGPLR